MKTPRDTIFITATTITVAEYLLLLCKMIEAASVDSESVVATENVA